VYHALVVLRLSLLLLRWKIKVRSFFQSIVALRVPHETFRKFFTFEIISFVSMFGFAMGLLTYHRFIAAIILFSVGFITLSVRGMLGAFSIIKPWKWAGVFVVFMITVCGELYLMGIVNQAESEYYSGLEVQAAATKTMGEKDATKLNTRKEVILQLSPEQNETRSKATAIIHSKPAISSPKQIPSSNEEQKRMAVTDRPYVFAISVQFKDDDQKVQVTYQNGGKTPAIGVGISALYVISPSSLNLNSFTIERFGKPAGSSGNVPGGGYIFSELHTGRVENRTAFESAKKDEKELQINVLGFVVYKDLDNYTYQSRFCYQWSPKDNAVRLPAKTGHLI
jgi:hypothetical protein